MGRDETMDGWTRALALGQGAYYLGKGLWPLLSLRSFEAVTRPRLEDWLVRTMGGFLTVVGATALLAGLRRRESPGLRLLAGSSAVLMGVVDVAVPASGRSAPLSLAGVPAELTFALGWTLSGLRARRRARSEVRPAEEVYPARPVSPRAAALAESTYPHAGRPAPA